MLASFTVMMASEIFIKAETQSLAIS